jgi:hypothetical protein
MSMALFMYSSVKWINLAMLHDEVAALFTMSILATIQEKSESVSVKRGYLRT